MNPLPQSPGPPGAARGWLSRLTALRLGFGGIIALLLISAVEAYRIQLATSGLAAQIYHRFAEQVDLQTRIRRAVYLGSVHSRDYMLNTRGDRLETLGKQLEEVKAEARAALERLPAAAETGSSFAALREKLQDFWTTVEATPERTRRMKGDQLYDYVQAEIVPRRTLVGALLRELEELSRNTLRQSEAAFERSRHNAMLRLLGMMGLSVLLGLAVARVSLRHAARLEREGARRFQEVAQAKQDLEQLSARLLEIQEDERRRLARELHDEIGQTLTALRIEISRAQAALPAGAGPARERLEEARALAEKILGTVRDISLLLRPALLDDLGLSAALQWQAEDFSRRSGIPCRYSEEGLEGTLADPQRTCVYRVVQEALNNCEKHSGAGQVRLQVRQGGRELVVEVEDDGRGFRLDGQGNPADAAGLGLLGLRERAGMLGGALQVDSAPGRGTRLRLRLPLPEHAPEAVLAQAGGSG